MGTTMPDGCTRYITNTNGGPLFVYVKDDRIVRMTPIDLDAEDAPSWTIRARGKSFTPRRRAMINPHAQCLKSLVYSDKRILYPMQRVDFDPDGKRNPQNRGKSGYVRISWDEAFRLVAGEIKRQRQKYGPGAMAIWHGLSSPMGERRLLPIGPVALWKPDRLHTGFATIRTAGKGGTGARCTISATACGSGFPATMVWWKTASKKPK